PLISGVDHSGNTEEFVVIGIITINVDASTCGGNTVTGTVASIVSDPYGIVNTPVPSPTLPAATNTPTATNTPWPTSTATNTPTPTPSATSTATATPTPIPTNTPLPPS